MKRRNKRRIIIHTQGGIGNQIFCFSAGLYVSDGDLNSLVIDKKNIDYSHAGPDFDLCDLLDISKVPVIQSKNLPIFLRRLRDSIIYRFSIAGRLYDSFLGVYQEERKEGFMTVIDFLNKSTLASLRRQVKINGYFQDFRIIEPNRSLIRSLFRGLRSADSIGLASQMEMKTVIGIHFRGGDYLNSDWNELVGTLSIYYYLKAIEIVRAEYPNAEIWVFTNDRVHAEAFIADKIHVSKIIDEKTFKNPAEDFQILSKCTAIIAANSTFSYTSSYFSETAKIVVVPNAFSKSGNQIPGIPENWVQIDPQWN